ncbi:MAG: TlpA disulfide reductase family protein [Pirellulaceae bacterium]
MPKQVITFLCWLLLANFVCAQQAAEQKSAVSKVRIEIGDIEPPSDDVEESLQFMDAMVALQQELSTQYRQAASDINQAQIKAAEVVLNSSAADDKQFHKAAQVGLARKISSMADASRDEQFRLFQLVKRQVAIGLMQGLQNSDVSNATALATLLERTGSEELAREANETFAELFSDAKNPRYKAYAENFAGTARRLGLLGNSMELEGKLLDGSDFNWEEYQGKVVLVDFWATWCGPCIAEAPNVMANYKKYHSRGFEVVGVSLDTDQKRLEAYVKENAVPWENLFTAGAGWKHPMATKYAIRAIPAVYLINREGKVVSMKARGLELSNQLEEIFNAPAELERALVHLDAQIDSDCQDAFLIGSRAAVYNSLGRSEEARKEWSRAFALDKGVAEQAFESFRTAELWADAVEYGREFVGQNPELPDAWTRVLPFTILAGDLPGYREMCAQMVEQFKDTKSPRIARLVCRNCLLAPNALDADKIPADRFLAMDKSKNPWAFQARAILALRNNNPEEAIKQVDGFEKDPRAPNEFKAKLTNPTLLAMAHAQLGKKELAQSFLATAEKEIKEARAQSIYRANHDVMIVMILFEEAKQMIDAM